MATFLVRIELPDRPGALGAVASRIGAVRGDVISIEIVRRGDGRAVDEFVVDLADAELVPLLLVEIGEVDGVSVEEVHPVAVGVSDQRLDAYDSAAAILEERSPHGVLTALSSRTRHELDAAWAAIIDVEDRMVIAAAGRPPAAPWLASHIRDTTPSAQPDGARPGTPSDDARPDGTRPDGARPEGTQPDGARPEGTQPDDAQPGGDIAWVHLAAWDLMLIVGRPTWPFATRERTRLRSLARLADARWIDLSEREARLSHPSRTG